MGAEDIRKDLDEFQASVKRLGSGVNRASVLWKDAKFQELSGAVRRIANMSRDVIVSGEECCRSIDRFESIAQEKY
ncbi:MAG: hypothetical protein LUC98_01815 [Lachnospiraceae bacterium]|nr:hypothetical protein [Lachnospiraceae bacterium]